MKPYLIARFRAFNYGDQTAERIYIHLLEKAQPNEQNMLAIRTSTGELKDELNIQPYTIGHHLRMFTIGNQITETRDPKERFNRTITFNTDTTTWIAYKAARQKAWQETVKAAHAAIAKGRAREPRRPRYEALPPIPTKRATEALMVIISFETTPKSLRVPQIKTFERLTGWPRKTVSKYLKNLEDTGQIRCIKRGQGRRETAYAAADNFHTAYKRTHNDLDAYIIHARLAGAKSNDL